MLQHIDRTVPECRFESCHPLFATRLTSHMSRFHSIRNESDRLVEQFLAGDSWQQIAAREQCSVPVVRDTVCRELKRRNPDVFARGVRAIRECDRRKVNPTVAYLRSQFR